MTVLSILIVNWNTRELLLGCLRSILASPPSCSYEIIVVDNQSSDGSAEAVRAAALPGIELIEAGANLGFAKANNLALTRARGELVLLLNPDTLVHQGALAAAVTRFQKEPGLGILGVKQLEADGRVQPSCGNPPSLRTLFLNPLAGLLTRAGAAPLARRLFRLAGLAWVPVKALRAYWDPEQEADVGWIMGSFLLMRRALATELGLFDERFSMYGEDMDLGLRVLRSGRRVLYYPGATITHFGGASTKKLAAEADAAHYLATIRFYEKHHGAAATLLYRLVLLAGSAATLAAKGSRTARLRAAVALAPNRWHWP